MNTHGGRKSKRETDGPAKQVAKEGEREQTAKKIDGTKKKNIAEIQEIFPEKHSCKMRREFKDCYHMFTKLTPLLLTDMYRRLTKDASVVPNQKALNRLNMLIDSDYIHCEDVIVDLRAPNEGRPSQFEKFWSGLGKVLNEYCGAAADSRCHGAATTPLAISIPDLK